MSPKGELAAGEKAPAVVLMDKDKNEVHLSDFKGKWVILYFYPKDNTSGCTQEAVDFTAHQKEFEKLNTVVMGVSPDSPESHCKFADKHDLTITLLSDVKHSVLEQYGAWKLKKMYGKEFMGVVRSTFLIDPKGVIRHIWPKVSVKGHVEEVKKVLRDLQKSER
jgi:peroxiredoxin Q/BCP